MALENHFTGHLHGRAVARKGRGGQGWGVRRVLWSWVVLGAFFGAVEAAEWALWKSSTWALGDRAGGWVALLIVLGGGLWFFVAQALDNA
jgi:hypothetical protein